MNFSMFYSRFIIFIWAFFLILVLVFATALSTAFAESLTAQSRRDTLNAAQIQQVQETLRSLGYDPGPADGVPGARTLLAVSQFQQQMGLPQTGRLDSALWRTLNGQNAGLTARDTPAQRRSEADAAAAAVAAIAPAAGGPQIAKASTEKAATPAKSPAPAAAPPAASAAEPRSNIAVGLVTGQWEIVDQDGARQTLRFVSGGTVSDALMPKFWKWRMENDLVVIEFDNGAGGWVHRVGRLIAENRIEGSAESSRKRIWNWTARRR